MRNNFLSKKLTFIGLIEFILLTLVMYLFLHASITNSIVLGLVGSVITILILHKTKTNKTRIILFCSWGIVFATLVIVSNTMVNGFFVCPYKIPLVGENAGQVYKIPNTDVERGIIPCPFGMLQNMTSSVVAKYSIAAVISMAIKVFGVMFIIWLVLTLIFGRSWCGWICPFGGISETFSRIGKKTYLKINWSNGIIRGLRYGFFFAVLLLTVGMKTAPPSAYYCNICANKAIWHSPGQALQALSVVSEFIVYFSFLAFWLILPFMTKKRVWCIAICPFGTLTSIVGAYSLLTTRVDENTCVNCKKCSKVCKLAAITEKDGSIDFSSSTCANCGECMNACPKDSIKYYIRGTNIEIRNIFIPIIVAMAIIIASMFAVVLWKPVIAEVLKLFG